MSTPLFAKAKSHVDARTVVFPIETLRQLVPFAARRKITVNELIRRMIDAALDDQLIDALLDDDEAKAA